MQKARVRIVVVGDGTQLNCILSCFDFPPSLFGALVTADSLVHLAGVGKTSLVTSLISNAFQEPVCILF